MKTDYSKVPDIFDTPKTSLSRADNKYFCLECRKTLDEKQYFRTWNKNKFPSGFLPKCKTCITMVVDDKNPDTFLSILKEMDIPYIANEWRSLLQKKAPGSGSILGKYASKMRLNQYKKYRWADTQTLMDRERETMIELLQEEGESEAEIEERVDDLLSFAGTAPSYIDPLEHPTTYRALTAESSIYGLSEDDIRELKQDWGADLTEEDYYQLERLFQEMLQAYVIQDPIAIANARIICKMTRQMNKCLDIADVESVAKLSRQLDLFIKTANLAPVQQKDRQQTTFAISQLAYLVEKEGGFIPEWDTSKPLDKIDMILQDMKEFTEYLVRGEPNIDELVEHAEQILAQDALPEALESYDEFAELEAELLGDMAAIDLEEGDYE